MQVARRIGHRLLWSVNVRRHALSRKQPVFTAKLDKLKLIPQRRNRGISFSLSSLDYSEPRASAVFISLGGACSTSISAAFRPSAGQKLQPKVLACQ